MRLRRERFTNSTGKGTTEMFVPELVGGNGRIIKALEDEYLRTMRQAYQVVPFHDPARGIKRVEK